MHFKFHSFFPKKTILVWNKQQRGVQICTPRCVSSIIIFFTLEFSCDIQARFHDRSALNYGGAEAAADGIKRFVEFLIAFVVCIFGFSEQRHLHGGGFILCEIG